LTLVGDERTRDETLPLIKQSLLNKNSFNSEIEVRELLRRVRDTATLNAIFSDPDVQELIRQIATCQEGSAWFVGTKATAISALALIDPATAYATAWAALKDESSHDRELYPYLMMQIDASRGMHDLIELAKIETRTSVQWSIARALSRIDCVEAVKTLIASASEADREVGCVLCMHGVFGGSLQDSLRRLLNDPSRDVATAAREALEAIESRRNTDRLVEAIMEEKDVSHRWVLLDAIIASADPGDERQEWPDWARRIVDFLPFAMQRCLAEGIDKRRKKVRETADKRDK
jgi:HEAT repeat protein